MFTMAHALHINCRIHRSRSVHLLSVSERNHSCTSNFSSSHRLNGLWRQGKWFSLTTHDALACTIRHRLQCIPRMEITESIIGRDTHQTTGTPGQSVIESNWILFRNPWPQVHSTPPKGKKKKKALNGVIKDGCTSLYACMQVILDYSS